MAKPIRLSLNIPFPGFYHSDYSAAIDYQEESFIDYRTTEPGRDASDTDSELSWPEELRLDSSDLASALFDSTCYNSAYAKVAGYYAAAFDAWAGHVFGFTVKANRKIYNLDTRAYATESYNLHSICLEFEEMTSPREYNFETDRLFCTIPLQMVRVMFNRSKAESHATLARVIARRFTSCSGFISFYSNRIADWLAKPVRDWDHNELGTLLLAALELAGGDPDSDEARGELYESTIDCEGDYRAWDSAVDWPKFDSKRLDARQDKWADWLDSDEAAALAWAQGAPNLVAALAVDIDGNAPATARCPFTLEMFPDTLAPRAI